MRWILLVVTVFFVAAAVWLVLLIRDWPFTEQAVMQALKDRFARQVQIRSFRPTYFPPGGVAEGVSFLHRKRKDMPPLITVTTLTIRGSYRGLLAFHKSVDKVEISGLHIQVPPKNGENPGVFPLTNSVSGKNLTIGEITTDGALLEFISKEPGKEPFRLKIDELKLDNVGESGPVGFHAVLRNTVPPGEVRSDGQIGPWNEDDPGSTPVSGSYTYQNVRLGFFEGIEGTLSARGKFHGVVGAIDSDGDVDVPSFRIKGNSHAIHLTTKYESVVNGTNGDTQLDKVQSSFQRTTFFSKGAVAGESGESGKTATLEVSAQQARVEDLLQLFATEARPSVVGPIQLRAKIRLVPGSQAFLTRLSLEGDFGIGGQRFTNTSLQASVNKLSESAQGESKKQQTEDSGTTLSNLKGHVTLKNGIAALSNISFTEPGTLAEIEGTYNLLDKKVNLHGVLHTNGKLSDTTTGFKAILLKAVGPLLKKKTITVVPFTITGTSDKPAFALDLAGKRKL
jgi:AsmA-like C-terminal region